jgi:WD40 repeat protein
MRTFYSVVAGFLCLCPLSVFSQAEQEPILILKKHSAPVTAVAFSPNGHLLLTGSEDRTMIIWSFPGGKVIKQNPGHDAPVRAFCFTPDGNTLISGGDKTMKLWDTLGNFKHSWTGPTTHIWSMSISNDGLQLVAGSYDKNFRTIDVAKGKVQKIFNGHEKNALAIVFSPTQHILASGSLDQTIRIWNSDSAKMLLTINAHAGNIYSLDFSPDGRYLLSASDDKTIKLWNVATGKLVRTYNGHTRAVMRAVFSPDGKHILSASADNTAILWETATGRNLYSFIAHEKPVNNVAFSADGKYCATASSDNTAMVWELNPGLFVEPYYEKEINAELEQSGLFAPRGKDEGKADYAARQKKAAAFREKVYNDYLVKYNEMLDKLPIE